MTHICVSGIRESHISLRVALRRARFEVQAILRQVHRMTPKWPQTLQSHRYTTYVLLVSPSPKFRPTISHFQDIAHVFYPLTIVLNGPKKKRPNKIEISNFTILLTTLVETPRRDSPGVYVSFWEQIWCILSEEMSFESVTSIWAHAKEKEYQMSKIQNLKFQIL